MQYDVIFIFAISPTQINFNFSPNVLNWIDIGPLSWLIEHFHLEIRKKKRVFQCKDYPAEKCLF